MATFPVRTMKIHRKSGSMTEEIRSVLQKFERQFKFMSRLGDKTVSLKKHDESFKQKNWSKFRFRF